MIRIAECLNKILSTAVVRADILNVIPKLAAPGDQGDIRGDMSGGTSAGQDDSFHTLTSRNCSNARLKLISS